jgi:hypothetical protein
MSNGQGEYSVAKTVKKGVFHSLVSLLPAAAGIAGVALQSPNVVDLAERAWPAGPAAVLVGAVVGMLNWYKNRSR